MFLDPPPGQTNQDTGIHLGRCTTGYTLLHSLPTRLSLVERVKVMSLNVIMHSPRALIKFYYSTTVLIENFTQIVRIFALSTVLYSTR